MLQGTPLDQLDRKHFPKGYQAPTSMKSEKEMAQQVSLSKEIAFAEVKMQKLCELLLEVFLIICACDNLVIAQYLQLHIILHQRSTLYIILFLLD